MRHCIHLRGGSRSKYREQPRRKGVGSQENRKGGGVDGSC